MISGGLAGGGIVLAIATVYPVAEIPATSKVAWIIRALISSINTIVRVAAGVIIGFQLVPFLVATMILVSAIVLVLLIATTISEEAREHCIFMYELCRTQVWKGPCGDCLNKCTAQGEWDFGLCHP